MIFNLKEFKPYIESIESGYAVKDNCPTDKLNELKKMNDEYMSIIGESLFIFPEDQKD